MVDPNWFTALTDRLHADPPLSRDEARSLSTECAALIARFDEEPDGAGFYAFGAVVSVFYASGAVAGDDDGALNSVKRFLDLVGAADDDGVAGLYDDAVRYLSESTPELRAALAVRVAAHATSIR